MSRMTGIDWDWLCGAVIYLPLNVKGILAQIKIPNICMKGSRLIHRENYFILLRYIKTSLNGNMWIRAIWYEYVLKLQRKDNIFNSSNSQDTCFPTYVYLFYHIIYLIEAEWGI